MNENKHTAKKQRETRTPATESCRAMGIAWDFLETVCATDNEGADQNQGESFAAKAFVEALGEVNAVGDDSANKIVPLFAAVDNPKSAALAWRQIAVTILHYVTQATTATVDGKHNEAWTYVVDAMYWSGIAKSVMIEMTSDHAAQNPASQMAKMRHAENYAIADEAMKYWREKIDPNISAAKAANELIRVVPFSHKKLAELVSAEKKKLP